MMTKVNKRKILVVDDNRESIVAIQAFLQKKGYECVKAHDSREAMEFIENDNISLVISDIVMPGDNGINLLKKAKASLPDLDFIIMTGFSSEYSYTEIINAGASDYITKPFEMNELSARIDRVEREKNMLTALKETNQKLEEAIESANEMAVKAEMASVSKN